MASGAKRATTLFKCLAAAGWLLSSLSIPAAATAEVNEQPVYVAEIDEGAFELRRYEPMIVAEVTHRGERSQALNAGFRRLAAYIFAEDRPGREESAKQSEAIAMTSPVLVDQVEEIAMTAPVMQDERAVDMWRTRFVMPRKYTLETLPEAPDDITLAIVPERRMAAVRFAGYSNTRNFAVAEEALRNWIAEQGLVAAGPPEFAFYDSPMVPPARRRSEVMIPVSD